MKTFKVGDRVMGPFGKGDVVCVGNNINNSVCVAYVAPGRPLHDGNKKATGFQHHTNNCYWSPANDLTKLNAVFKGNIK